MTFIEKKRKLLLSCARFLTCENLFSDLFSSSAHFIWLLQLYSPARYEIKKEKRVLIDPTDLN